MSRLLSIWFWIIAFLISIIWMLYLGSNPEEITQWWKYLLAYNLSFSLLATWLIVRNILHLKKQESSGVLGTKLTISFIKMVPLIAILPLVSFYFFSFNSIQGSLVDIGNFAQDLQKERQEKLDNLASDLGHLKLAQYQDKTQSLLNVILQNNNYDPDDEQYQPTMQSLAQYLVDLSLICDIEIYNKYDTLLAAARNFNACPETVKKISFFINLPLYESDEFLDQKFFKSQAVYRPQGKTELSISTIYSLDKASNNFLNKLNDSRHSQLNIELNLAPLRNAFLVDISSTLLLTILSILMIIFKMINTLMRPLNDISKATKQVAQGNYDVFIAKSSKGDVGILIDLFNYMASEVKVAQHNLDTQRIYLETILKYSYGVIALDENYNIRLLNPEIDKILKTKNMQQFKQKDYLSITQEYPQLLPLTIMIKSHFASKRTEWGDSIELMINNHSILLLCQGSRLETDEGNILGYVIVIKDITELRQAQNKAAWAAIAMKMAHEIKNPLTPIQLSAERLRHKLLPKLMDKDAQMLDKTTKIITQQVKSIDTLVSAFSQYTQTPVLDKHSQLLSELVTQAMELYEAQTDIIIQMKVSQDEPVLLLDSNSILRTLINLIKNAIEAKRILPIKIDISVSYIKEKSLLVLSMADNGTGLAQTIKETVFEPYVSTKTKGGGLGMSIVKSILKEHNATISIDNVLFNNEVVGAKVLVIFKLGEISL